MTLRRKETESRDLSALLEKRWVAYALAGAGAVAAAPAAHAGIVFTAPVGDTVNVSCGTSFCSSATSSPLNIDLDNNATTDFSLVIQIVSSSGFITFHGLGTTPAQAYRTTNGFGFPDMNGLSIGPAPANFGYSLGPVIIPDSPVNWVNGDHILGLQFSLDGTDENYGWVDLNTTLTGGVGAGSNFTLTVEGYAYQTTINTPIVGGDTGAGGATPEPGTAGLALLALGAGGVGAWRKRKQAQRAA